jgi:hypothetical protein
MSKEVQKITPTDLINTITSEIQTSLNAKGITVDKLAALAKQEIGSKATRTIKVKGAVNPKDLPKGYRIVAETGVIEEDETGKRHSTGETIIEVSEINWNTRQKGRQDLHKLMGHYPPEVREVILNERLIIAVLNVLPPEEAAELKKLLLADITSRRS